MEKNKKGVCYHNIICKCIMVGVMFTSREDSKTEGANIYATQTKVGYVSILS